MGEGDLSRLRACAPAQQAFQPPASSTREAAGSRGGIFLPASPHFALAIPSWGALHKQSKAACPSGHLGFLQGMPRQKASPFPQISSTSLCCGISFRFILVVATFGRKERRKRERRRRSSKGGRKAGEREGRVGEGWGKGKRRRREGERGEEEGSGREGGEGKEG